MDIRLGGLHHKQVIALLSQHHNDMLLHSPPGSVHALDISSLASPNISFWGLWDNNELAGVGALKALSSTAGEIKSMRTSSRFLRKGVAHTLLNHIIEEAGLRSYQRLSLETGTAKAFLPAKKLYEQFGFIECSPFGDYSEDPFSMFMTREIIV